MQYAEYLASGSTIRLTRNDIYSCMKVSNAAVQVQRIAEAQKQLFYRARNYMSTKLVGDTEISRCMFHALLGIPGAISQTRYESVLQLQNDILSGEPKLSSFPSKPMLTAMGLTRSTGILGLGALPGPKNRIFLLLTDAGLIYSNEFRFRIFFWESVLKIEMFALNGNSHYFKLHLKDEFSGKLHTLAIPANTSFGNTAYFAMKALTHVQSTVYPGIAIPQRRAIELLPQF